MYRHLFALTCSLVLLIGLTAQAGTRLGIDVLADNDFSILKGKRVGLVTNQTGVNGSGTKTRVVLKKHVNLVALYTPEHGLDGTEKAGAYVSSRRDPVTGVMAHSLYGPTRKPTASMLKGIDVLVYDMQDIGCRSYTYISTMIKCMEAAGANGLEFVVLDRPNPLGGNRIEGPGMEKQWISFIGQVPTPYVHGMTVGEIARMANALGWSSPRCNVKVVEMRGWSRGMVWADTGLSWVRPSPNIPHADSSAYYVATGLVGELPVDIGAGGPLPFEIFVSSGIDPDRLTAHMKGLEIKGVSFSPYPKGVRLKLSNRSDTDLTAINVHLLIQANRMGGSLFARAKSDQLNLFYKGYGSSDIRKQVESGVSAEKIIAGWQSGVSRFRSARQPYLIY